MAQPRPSTMRVGTKAKAAASRSSSGWNSCWNCGTPKRNSPSGAVRPASTNHAAMKWATFVHRFWRKLTPASASASQAAMRLNAAPQIISMWVGLHIVTSMP